MRGSRCISQPTPEAIDLNLVAAPQSDGALIHLRPATGLGVENFRVAFQPGGSSVYSDALVNSPRKHHQRAMSPVDWVYSEVFNQLQSASFVLAYDEEGVYEVTVVYENVETGARATDTATVDLSVVSGIGGVCAPISAPNDADLPFEAIVAGLQVTFSGTLNFPTNPDHCPGTFNSTEQYFDPGDGSGLQFSYTPGWVHTYAEPGTYMAGHRLRDGYTNRWSSLLELPVTVV